MLDQYKRFMELESGDRIERPVWLSAMEESTGKNGKSYMTFVLKDGESDIKARMFDKGMKDLEAMGIKVQTVVDVTLAVDTYNNAKSYMIKSIGPCADQSLSGDDFTKMPPVDIDLMYNEIIDLVKSVAAPPKEGRASLADLTLEILTTYKKSYITSSAAVAMHHNLKGGLLYHSYRMAKAAEAVSHVYTSLDRELLICGTVLHDIGKVWEYRTGEWGDAVETPKGVLFGHLYIGAMLIQHHARDTHPEKKYDKERVNLLVHMVLSHHGTQEWGAVAVPAIPEAYVLHYIDNMDAKIYVCEETIGALKPGEITPKKPFGMDNSLYRPRIPEEGTT